MLNWRQSTKNTKVELFSAVLLWKMILKLAQFFLPSKDHQHLEMTAAKVMDIISRQTGCAGQAADAVSVYTQVKNGRCSEIIESSQIGVSRHLDSSTMTQLAKIMVQYGRPSRSCWAKSVPSFFGRTVMGKAIWETFIAARLGEGFQLGMRFRTPLKKHSSHLCMWVTSNWLERNKILIRCGNYSMKLIWENQHLSWSCIFGGTQGQCEKSKDI